MPSVIVKKLVKIIKWFYPGLKVKRWILLTAISIIMVSMSIAVLILEQRSNNRLWASIVVILGIIGVITGIKRILKSFITIFLPEHEEDLVDIIYQKRLLERGPRIVVIGGGTGLSVLLHGLKDFTNNITAIVTVADDGGSSGILRKEFGILPPGDIRNCLVALADAEPLMGKLFQFRFDQGSSFDGHSFGNLFITAMTKVTGDFEKAIKESSKVLAIRGSVVPSTLEKVTLVAEYKDGSESIGESRIPEKHVPIKKVYLRPNTCKATEEAIKAIQSADVILFGPGSLYTSVLPNLLVEGIKEAVSKAKKLKIYICNVMTQPGETDNFKASDHLRVLIEHTNFDIINTCIVNTGRIHENLLEKYKSEGSRQVFPDLDLIREMGYKSIGYNIVSTKDFVRHDPRKLSKIILELINEYRNKKKNG